MTAIIGGIITLIVQILGLVIDKNNQDSAATKWYLDFVSSMIKKGLVNPKHLRDDYKNQDPKFPDETPPTV